ncbi:MAG: imidazolonepropionase, partial [Cyclonatronaceae bacterium]
MMPSQILQQAVLLAGLLLGPLGLLHAQAPTPAPEQSAPVALEGATIHTMAGEVIENGSLLFENGVITRIGTNISDSYPPGTQRRDLSGKHLYPGLIDAWNQIGIYEIGAVNMTTDIAEEGPVNPNVRVEQAFNPESRHIAIGRSAGVLTSITTPGGGLVSGQSAAMMMDGWTWEEMTLKSGVGMVMNWPNARNDERYAEQLGELQEVFDSARAYRQARRAMEAGSAPHHDFDSRLHAMMPLFEGEMPVVVNANEVQQIQDAVTWAASEGLEIIILGGRDAALVAGHLREKDVPVIVTTVLNSPFRNWEAYDTRYALPLK